MIWNVSAVWPACWRLPQAHGVTRLLSVATDLESWPALARLTEPYPQIALSVGCTQRGRWTCPNEGGADSTGPRIAGGGHQRNRAGLPLRRRQRRPPADWFRVHIAAARELGKPLIVHTRAARADTLRILKRRARPRSVGAALFHRELGHGGTSAGLELSRLVFRHRHLQERQNRFRTRPGACRPNGCWWKPTRLSGAGSVSG